MKKIETNQLAISVIIPVYNGERYLAEAIASIENQRHYSSETPLEIIVIDDGSTDGTAHVITSFDDTVRYAYQANAGPAAAINRGIATSRGNVLAFLDADDLWCKDKLTLQLGLLQENSATEIVIGYTQFVRAKQPQSHSMDFEHIAYPHPIPSLGSAMIRRSAIETVGLFDENMRYNHDVDWFLRAKEVDVSTLMHEETVQLYRRHAGNITNQQEPNNRYFIHAIKHSLDRRRAQNNGTVPLLAGWLDDGLALADDNRRKALRAMKAEQLRQKEV